MKMVQRITVDDPKINGNLEVRNYLDGIEDLLNNKLSGIAPEIIDLMAESATYHAMFGRPLPTFTNDLMKLMEKHLT